MMWQNRRNTCRKVMKREKEDKRVGRKEGGENMIWAERREKENHVRRLTKYSLQERRAT